MNIKEKYNYITELEDKLNKIVKVIEIIDPILNDTDSNNFTDKVHGEMVRIPWYKAWLKVGARGASIKVETHYTNDPIELDMDGTIVNSISESLCKKRDWYRNKIKEVENEW